MLTKLVYRLIKEVNLYDYLILSKDNKKVSTMLMNKLSINGLIYSLNGVSGLSKLTFYLNKLEEILKTKELFNSPILIYDINYDSLFELGEYFTNNGLLWSTRNYFNDLVPRYFYNQNLDTYGIEISQLYALTYTSNYYGDYYNSTLVPLKEFKDYFEDLKLKMDNHIIDKLKNIEEHKLIDITDEYNF